MTIHGYFLDGKTSGRVPARLDVSSSDLNSISITLEEDATPAHSIKFSEIHFSSRLGNTPRELTFKDDALFITEDNDAIVWDIHSGEKIEVLKGHHDNCISACVTSDGKYLLAGSSDQTVIVRDISKLIKDIDARFSLLHCLRKTATKASDRSCSW